MLAITGHMKSLVKSVVIIRMFLNLIDFDVIILVVCVMSHVAGMMLRWDYENVLGQNLKSTLRTCACILFTFKNNFHFLCCSFKILNNIYVFVVYGIAKFLTYNSKISHFHNFISHNFFITQWSFYSDIFHGWLL